MKRVIIVQARMTSTRLPGKVLKDLSGRPMLAQQLRRLRRCRAVNEIVIATTENASDDPVIALAQKEQVPIFRGSENDVLSRFVGAARRFQADVVVRITADCPLIDPEVVDAVVTDLTDHRGACDYASNVQERTYPRGLDVEAFFRDTLERMDRLADTPLYREHVTAVLREDRAGLFLSRSIVDTQNNADLRWTVDTDIDLALIRAIYRDLNLDQAFVGYRDILAHVRSQPALAGMNAGVETWDPAGR
jgi:spore coat polysaccharide biosynthesis protein SpsF